MPHAFTQIRCCTVLVLLAGYLAAAAPARADTVTECTLDKFCYCVDAGLTGVIEQQATAVREMIGKKKRRARRSAI